MISLRYIISGHDDTNAATLTLPQLRHLANPRLLRTYLMMNLTKPCDSEMAQAMDTYAF